MTFSDLINKIQAEAFLEVLDENGYLVQDGINGETIWEDRLLDCKIYLIIPGISIKILLSK